MRWDKDRKKYHAKKNKEIICTIVFRWIMVFFCSTRFALCHVNLIKDRIAFLKNVPEKNRIRFFIFRNFSLFFPRGRSPPSNLKLKPKNFRLEEIT